MVICLERSADLHMAQLMPLSLTVSCFSKIQIGFTLWYRLTWVVPEKGPLNECVLDIINNSDHHFTAIIHINLHCLAPPVKNWRISLVIGFTAHMPLLTATSACRLGRRRLSSPRQCYLHCLCTLLVLWFFRHRRVKTCET